MSEEGLEAIARLKAEGIKTNCTLIFSANQGLLAAKAGASILSPFVGRLDDINEHGMEVVRELVAMVRIHDLSSEVLVASIRHPRHVTEAALAGAHIATVPHKVLRQMIHHPLTDTGILQFRKDWDTVHAPGHHHVSADVARPDRLTPIPDHPSTEAGGRRTHKGAADVAR
jgi:transaldolase